MIRDLGLGVRTVAVASSVPCGGSLFADQVYEVPAYSQDGSPGALNVLGEICKKECVQLIIPCSDYETYFFQSNAGMLPKVACSNADVSLILYDKWLTASEFYHRQIPFVETWLPSQALSLGLPSPEIILKPRRGGLSQGVSFRPSLETLRGCQDADYIIQRLVTGSEITVCFYVRENGELHGLICLETQRKNGISVRCETTRRYDRELRGIIARILAEFPVRMSCNLQAIVTADGHICPFELNGRISGTAPLRHRFGFQDVAYILYEQVFKRVPPMPDVREGCAFRVLHDYVFFGRTLSQLEPNAKPDQFF